MQVSSYQGEILGMKLLLVIFLDLKNNLALILQADDALPPCLPPVFRVEDSPRK